MGDFNHHNTDYEDRGYTSEVPERTGDRYYAQDSVRDLQYLRDLIGSALANIASEMPVIISGGVVTKGSGDTLNITPCIGYAKFEVDVINAFASPPTVKQVKLNGVEIRSTQQTNLVISSATLDGSTVNYVKLKYAETDGNTRSRAKASGSYAYERVPSFTIVVNSTATLSDGTEIQLDTFTGSAGGTFVFSGSRTSGVNFGIGAPSSLVDVRLKNHDEKLGQVSNIGILAFINESFSTNEKIQGILVNDYTSGTLTVDIEISSGEEIKAPKMLQIHDGTNSSLIYLTSNTGTAVSNGFRYNCANIGTSYLASASTVSNSGLDITGGIGKLDTGLTGTALTNSYHFHSCYSEKISLSGLIKWSVNWKSSTYEVISFPSGTQIEIDSGFDNTAFYPNGSKIYLYRMAFDGIKWRNVYDSVFGTNFIELTVSSASYSGGTQRTTITHGGSNSNDGFASNGTKFFVSKKNITPQYRKSTDTLSEPTISILRSTGPGNTLFFEDLFNRPDSTTIGNDWIKVQNADIVSDKLKLGASSGSQGSVYRSKESYGLSDAPKRFTLDISDAGSDLRGCLMYGLSTAPGAPGWDDSGIVSLYWSETEVRIYHNGSQVASQTSPWNPTFSGTYNVIFEVYKTKARAKFFTGSEPSSWTIEHDNGADYTITGTYLGLQSFHSSQTHNVNIDNLKVYSLGADIITEGQISNIDAITNWDFGVNVEIDDSAEAPEVVQFEANLIEA
jgi:hypothetical protein